MIEKNHRQPTDDQDGNTAYHIMFQDGTARWVRPPELFRTEDSHNSVLDFAISNLPGLKWGPESTILTASDDFTDTANKSDHRPIDLIFDTDKDEDVPQDAIVRSRLRRDIVFEGLGREQVLSMFRSPTESAQPMPGVTDRQALLEQIRVMRQQLEVLERAIRDMQ